MLTRMEFKFSEEKCKKYGVTLNACYKTIEKLMAEYDIHQYGLGVYVASLKKAFTPFSLLACDLPASVFLIIILILLQLTTLLRLFLSFFQFQLN